MEEDERKKVVKEIQNTRKLKNQENLFIYFGCSSIVSALECGGNDM